MRPAIGSPVTMPAVLLGVQIMTHAGTTRLLPLPGAGVYDPTMPECLVSVAQLLAASYDIVFRLPKDCGTDGFDNCLPPLRWFHHYTPSGHYAKPARFYNHAL